MQLARADEHLGAYLGVAGAARRSWAKQNEQALVGFIRAYRAGVAFLYGPPTARSPRPCWWRTCAR